MEWDRVSRTLDTGGLVGGVSKPFDFASAALRSAGGPRRPNAARALCKESYIDEYPAIRAPRAALFLFRPVR